MKKDISPRRHRGTKEGLFTKEHYFGIAILIITFIAFFPSLKNDFMPTWDDEKYVTSNPLVMDLNLTNVRMMFTRPVNGSYVPLPLLTFAMEYNLFGNTPFPFHATNLLLHLICTFLVFRLFRLLGLDVVYAAFGALLFGIHPMRVESVAWISERKDVMYGCFYLLSIIMYIKYTQEQSHRSRFMMLGILSFFLALLSKIEAVTLPVSLLLIDFLMKRPFNVKVFTEKIPYFILSLFFGAVGILIIYRAGLKMEGFLKANETETLFNRLFYALYALNGYLLKFFAPFWQSAIYVRPRITGGFSLFFYFVDPALLLFLVYFIYRSARNTRVIVFGTLFFLVSVIFLLQVFSVGIAFFADRYTYIPYIGLFFITAWAAEQIITKKPQVKNTTIGILTILSLIFITMTYNRCKIWKDGVTLWTNVIEQYPDESIIPYANRGIAYTNLREWELAISDFSKAISVDPKSAAVYADRGFVYGMTGQPEEAIADFTTALKIDPVNSKALQNRGVAYVNTGQDDKAIADFQKTIQIEPKYIKAYVNLGLIYLQQKKFDDAIEISKKGLKIVPQVEELFTTLGNCWLEKGENDKAIDQFQNSIRMNGEDLDAVLGLAAAFYNKKDLVAANGFYAKAASIEPSLNAGIKGLNNVERSGMIIPEIKKESLVKLISERH
jgi:protein O-mannosyl-transferase